MVSAPPVVGAQAVVGQGAAEVRGGHQQGGVKDVLGPELGNKPLQSRVHLRHLGRKGRVQPLMRVEAAHGHKEEVPLRLAAASGRNQPRHLVELLGELRVRLVLCLQLHLVKQLPQGLAGDHGVREGLRILLAVDVAIRLAGDVADDVAQLAVGVQPHCPALPVDDLHLRLDALGPPGSPGNRERFDLVALRGQGVADAPADARGGASGHLALEGHGSGHLV
mmetsp:Transcript_80264/g.249141  ORF Transcript_80264/g.249141 Transcript_80264/m.249141 type:complete len:222 (-) Transcript_80264:283-948(-)